MLSDDRTNPTANIWDERSFKALLDLPRFPVQIIQEEPWKSWLEARGGIQSVRSYLLTCDMPPGQRDLLQAILDYPGAPVEYYIERLGIGSSTYFRRMNNLTIRLCPYLNDWEADTSTAGNLPTPLTSLIGMDTLWTMASSAISRPDVRLLTITGPGGVGKTRFALQLATWIAADFKDGVYFVPLAAIGDATLLVAEIMRVLGLENSGGQSLLFTLKAHLHERQILLLLDSFDHLLGAASVVTELLWQAPEVKIITTSREILCLSGEHRFEVPLLDVPDLRQLPPLNELLEYSAIRLFVERAQAVCPDFTLAPENASAVAQICCSLDGLPLAIELAAARIKLFSPQQMLSQIDNRAGLDFLKGGMRDKDVRHQTLWNTIDWSYTLLSEREKSLFRKLAVFAGDWSVEAGLSVCDTIDVEMEMEVLVHKSLVQVVSIDGSKSSRFQMLQTIHEYAGQQLEAGGDLHEMQRRHAYYYLSLLEEADQSSEMPLPRKLTHIKQEHSNLQVALKWALSEEPETALRLVAGILPFWGQLKLMSGGQPWAEQILAQTRHLKIPTRVNVLLGASWQATSRNDYVKGASFVEEALALAKELDDKYLIAASLHGVGEILVNQQEYQQARSLFEESLTLFSELGDKVQIAWTLDHLGNLAQQMADPLQARLLLGQAVDIFQEIGYPGEKSVALVHLGRALLDLGETQQARSSLENALALREELGLHWPKDWANDVLGHVLLAQGEYVSAGILFRESLMLHSEEKDEWGVISSLMDFAALAIVQTNYAEAVQLSSMVSTRFGGFAASIPAKVAQMTKTMEAKFLPVAQEHLSQESYDRAWEEGKTMLIGDVVSALKDGKALPVISANPDEQTKNLI
ncbi:MAG: tetratricopeptide repeat protein [Anaerolineae bacterium]|nr:tetratricopeptide repeat protein [Anaerolineae bacterium]